MENVLTSSLNVGPINVLIIVLTISYWIFIALKKSGQIETPPAAPQSVADFNTTSLYYSAFSNDYTLLGNSPNNKTSVIAGDNGQKYLTSSTPFTAREIAFDYRECRLDDTTKVSTAELLQTLGVKVSDINDFKGPFETPVEQVSARNCLIQLLKHHFLRKEDSSVWARMKHSIPVVSGYNPNTVNIDGVVYEFEDYKEYLRP